MTFLKSLIVLAAMAPVILIAAYGVPSLFIQTDLESLINRDLKAVEYAEEALWSIGHGRCSQLAALICTGVKIIQVSKWA